MTREHSSLNDSHKPCSPGLGHSIAQGKDVIAIRESESVALLSGVTHGVGLIEAEIAPATFGGIAFRAADKKNYDLLYFRRQHSVMEKH